jgi:hypothetical protein
VGPNLAIVRLYDALVLHVGFGQSLVVDVQIFVLALKFGDEFLPSNKNGNELTWIIS